MERRPSHGQGSRGFVRTDQAFRRDRHHGPYLDGARSNGARRANGVARVSAVLRDRELLYAGFRQRRSTGRRHPESDPAAGSPEHLHATLTTEPLAASRSARATCGITASGLWISWTFGRRPIATIFFGHEPEALPVH